MAKIEHSTFEFLNQLKDNNNREWFSDNKSLYIIARQNVEAFAENVLKTIRKVDNTIPESLLAKQCLLRIYRDIRFSNNKTPYKTHFGISISASGKGTGRPGYYLHIEPGQSFVAGGYWAPDATDLKAIRQEIDYNTSDFLKIIDSKEFKDYFGGLDKSDTLKLAPKGYDVDHTYIDLLKLKSFIGIHDLSNKLITSEKGIQEIAKGVSLIYPLNTFLQNALA